MEQNKIHEFNLIKSINNLNHKNKKVRLKAAQWLMENPNKKAVNPLIEALKDEDCEVRLCSLLALRYIRDPTTIDPILLMLKDDEEEIRMEAAETLFYIGESREIEEKFIDHIRDPSWYYEGDPSVIAPVIDLLYDKSWRVRYRSLKLISKVNDPKIVEHLIKMINDEKQIVRITLYDILEELEISQAIEPLKELYEEEEDEDMRVILKNRINRIKKRTHEKP